MAAIDFPASPSVGQVFTAGNGVSYQWNGTQWLLVGATVSVAPPGGLMPYAGTAEPPGWVFANGQAISRTGANAALFATIGTTYGVGDGSTTFNVPDLCSRAPVGLDNMGGITAKGRLTNLSMSPNATTMGATGGAQQNAATTTVNGTAVTNGLGGTAFTNGLGVSVGVTVSGGLGGSISSGGLGSVTTSGGSTAAQAGDPVFVSGSLGGGGSGSVSGNAGISVSGNASASASGTSSNFNVVQPTLLLNYIIKL